MADPFDILEALYPPSDRLVPSPWERLILWADLFGHFRVPLAPQNWPLNSTITPISRCS
jgi:hypothetical protein